VHYWKSSSGNHDGTKSLRQVAQYHHVHIADHLPRPVVQDDRLNVPSIPAGAQQHHTEQASLFLILMKDNALGEVNDLEPFLHVAQPDTGDVFLWLVVDARV
jgi:hypothetical protein